MTTRIDRVEQDLLVANPLRLLDGLSLARLREVSTYEQVIEAAGFTIHYWRRAAPASMVDATEIVAEHRESGLWFASRPEMESADGPVSTKVRLIEQLLAAPGLAPAPTLATLTLAVAAKAEDYLVKLGEHWTAGGLLIGCLYVHEQHATSPSDIEAIRTLIALANPTVLGDLDRLACWQDNVDTDRHDNTAKVVSAYEHAVETLWPQFSGAAATVAGNIKPERLLSHPPKDWPREAVQIVLAAVAGRETYVVRPLEASWHLAEATRDVRFTLEALLAMARVPDGLQVPDVASHW